MACLAKRLVFERNETGNKIYSIRRGDKRIAWAFGAA